MIPWADKKENHPIRPDNRMYSAATTNKDSCLKQGTVTLLGKYIENRLVNLTGGVI